MALPLRLSVLLTGLLLAFFLAACGTPAFYPTPTSPSTELVVPTPGLETPAPRPSPQPVPRAPDLGPPVERLPAGTIVTVEEIHMLDARRGWALGGLGGARDHVLRTQDGGQTWQDVTPPEPQPADPSLQLRARAFFRDADSAWVVFAPRHGYPPPEYGLVWVTRDGGLSWQYGLLELDFPPDHYLPDAPLVLPDGQGWLLVHVGAGMHHDYVVLYRTLDDGQTWEMLLSPFDDGGIQSCMKVGMAFLDTRTGWLAIDCQGVAPDPYAFRSQDGGRTWERLNLPAPAGRPELFQDQVCGAVSLSVLPPGTVLLLLSCRDYDVSTPAQTFYLYRSLDHGLNWQILPYPGGQSVFFDSANGLALSRTLNRTQDGGQTWQTLRQVFWDGQFSFVDPLRGWAVARDGDLIALVWTEDGGRTWREISQPLIAP
jgi:photosystem II stability/assembly factor-like uncharacterized protein